MYEAVPVTATGDALDTGQPGALQQLGGASLLGAAAAATAIIRNGGSGGDIIAVLGTGIGLADHFTPRRPVNYRGKVHVTLTGAPTVLVLYKA